MNETTRNLRKKYKPVKSLQDRIDWLDKRDMLGTLLKLAKLHKVTLGELLGTDRSKHIVRARHAAWKWLRECDEGWSYPSIADAFGVDHTTVMAAVKKGTER